MKTRIALLLPGLLVSCGGAAVTAPTAPTAPSVVSVVSVAAPPVSSAPPKAQQAAPAQTAPPAAEAKSGSLPLRAAADDRGTIVFLADGNGRVGGGGQAFKAGSLIFVRPATPFALEGSGLGFVFRVQPIEIVFQMFAGPYFVLPQGSRERLTWGQGKMAATQYFSDPSVYVGALEGSLPVAEHIHEKSWELICATRAAGTFTLDGVASRLANGGCVSVPPGHKHSWIPDPGTSLVALQVYSPGGPEARFRTLAAQDANPPATQ